ncbi:hypothetical protein GALMADRAFT_1022840 [Galerina marginata CBS 339.88]|uniref:Uncharacterized protein n=1 Tax=Galerina marginata (strain CBS 339.88) TaxID=685588 RepID=A0A067SCR7_GALM3|nr:hypothetical protein GALMADRAFT_1022840 [Galerina marginata CBS 339.88]
MAEVDIPVKTTGFPFGYFRIRTSGTDGDSKYLIPHYGETQDGNALVLGNLDRHTDKFVYFINAWGALCCKEGGVSIDVINNKLVVAHNRPTTETQQWPNPWSHYLPSFSYSRQTKLITIQFHADPLLCEPWPRPESEWKDKKFVVTTRCPMVTRVCRFSEIARWAPSSELRPQWTSRGGDHWPVHGQFNVAVEEMLENFGEEDLKRMQWEIETDV